MSVGNSSVGNKIKIRWTNLCSERDEKTLNFAHMWKILKSLILVKWKNLIWLSLISSISCIQHNYWYRVSIVSTTIGLLSISFLCLHCRYPVYNVFSAKLWILYIVSSALKFLKWTQSKVFQSKYSAHKCVTYTLA